MEALRQYNQMLKDRSLLLEQVEARGESVGFAEELMGHAAALVGIIMEAETEYCVAQGLIGPSQEIRLCTEAAVGRCEVLFIPSDLDEQICPHCQRGGGISRCRECCVTVGERRAVLREEAARAKSLAELESLRREGYGL